MTSVDGSKGDDAFVELDPVDIMLIEPNLGDTRLFSESFAEASITNRVDVVTDGESALAFLRQRGEYDDAPHPDIVLVEPELPDVDAEAVIAEIRENPDLEETAVIALAGSRTEADILRCGEFDADEYFVKPVEADAFVDFVSSVEEFWVALVRRPGQE